MCVCELSFLSRCLFLLIFYSAHNAHITKSIHKKNNNNHERFNFQCASMISLENNTKIIVCHIYKCAINKHCNIARSCFNCLLIYSFAVELRLSLLFFLSVNDAQLMNSNCIVVARMVCVGVGVVSVFIIVFEWKGSDFGKWNKKHFKNVNEKQSFAGWNISWE